MIAELPRLAGGCGSTGLECREVCQPGGLYRVEPDVVNAAMLFVEFADIEVAGLQHEPVRRAAGTTVEVAEDDPGPR